jgi:MoxR-like ATPase
MVFAGTLYGAILSVWGEPGTAKSTAQQVAAAVWGHPKQTRRASTVRPLQRR